jgi:hypothetical protein
MFRAVLAKHGSYRNNCTSKDARKASSYNHLPQRLTQAEQGRRDGNTKQREDEDWFSSVVISSLSTLGMCTCNQVDRSHITFPQNNITHI